MKKVLLFISIFIFLKTNAQTPNYEWGSLIGGTMDMYVYDNATDANGNVYITGEYSGTVDFDPGTGTQNQTATGTGGRDIFILKLNANGTFGWVKTYGGTGVDFGQRITVDNSGNVLVAGRFQNTVTFTGYSTFNSNGGYDGFLLKLNNTGTLQWVVKSESTLDDGFLGIVTDSSGNIYTTGYFIDSIASLSSTNGTFVGFTNGGSGANYDFFVAKYNTNGVVVWSNSTGSNYDQISYDIAITDDNKVIIVGTFKGTSVDFYPQTFGNFLLYSNSNTTTTGFIQVLNASAGTFEWARSLGSTSNDAVFGVATANNNIYVTGYFSGSQADFNTTGSGGGDVISRWGVIDSFVAKYSSTSTFLWVKGIRGTTGADVRGVSIASKGNPERVYVTGTYTQGVYLDPLTNTSTGNFGGKDVFVSSYDDAGLYQWGGRMISMSNDDAGGISVDDNYNVFISGYVANDNFQLTPFGGLPVTPRVGNSGNDMFITKLAQPNACIVNIPDANFKNYLVNNSVINTNGDTEIQCNEASAFTGTIDCSSMSISSLTGIEAFTNLTNLNCTSNQLTTIDLSNNLLLSELRIMFNSLSAIDVSQNTALSYLDVGFNSLASIDVTNNLALAFLGCYHNLIENIDISANSNLINIACYGNSQLMTLNVANGNNSNFTAMNALTNPNLTCIQIDATFTPPSNGTWSKDATASYSDNCAALGTTSFVTTSLKIYPNPVTDFMTLQADEEIEKVTLYNYAGQEMKIVQFQNKMDISNLASGIYILKVRMTNGIETMEKIIKE